MYFIVIIGGMRRFYDKLSYDILILDNNENIKFGNKKILMSLGYNVDEI